MTIRLPVLVGLVACLPLGVACANAPDDDAPLSESESALMSTPGVPVYLNHAYGVLDPAITTALGTNEYLASTFIDVEVRTTVRPDLTYTGTYLNALDTYLEYFPDGALGLPAGSAGVGLGDEVKGGLQKVCGKWESVFGAGQAEITPTTHEINGVQTPWFDGCDIGWTFESKYIGFWAMEYVPAAGSTAPRTRREERSARYAPSKLAQNVQSVVFAMEDGDRANTRRSLASAGWSILPLGASFVALSPLDHGVRRSITVTPSAPGKLGMVGVLFRLNRFASHTEHLGPAVLQVGIVGRPYAALWFAPPTPEAEAAARAQAL